MNANRRCRFAVSSEDPVKLGSTLKRDHVPRRNSLLRHPFRVTRSFKPGLVPKEMSNTFSFIRSDNSSRREAAT
jgi:hypothetical protein